MCISAYCAPYSHAGAHLQTATDHEARQVPLRHHLGDRAGAAGRRSLRRRRRGAGVRPQDRYVLPQAARLRLLGALLRLLGPQLPG